ISKKIKFINMDETIEIKTMRICFPIIAEIISGAVRELQPQRSSDHQNLIPKEDLDAKTIKFLFEAKMLAKQQQSNDIQRLFDELKQIILPVLEVTDKI